MNSKCCNTGILSSEKIKAEAFRLGFSACGIAPATPVGAPAAPAFRQWLAEDCHAGMSYMQNHLEKRLDPQQLMEGTQAIVSVALNYYPEEFLPQSEYQLAWYAYGQDYHNVMKAKLHALLQAIQAWDEGISGRVFCDTAPVLERYWAWRAGLGWIGKNTQLILPRAGSCFFLGEVFLTRAADAYDVPLENRCGSCHRCLDACPTHALKSPFKLDANRCLSYLTIEHRGEFPPGTGKKMQNRIYGCDECQRACPWNRFATASTTPEFQPSPHLLNMRKEDWHQLTEKQYSELFKGSAVKRAKYAGLRRNIEAVRTTEEEKRKDPAK